MKAKIWLASMHLWKKRKLHQYRMLLVLSPMTAQMVSVQEQIITAFIA
jgi:hypothetical protein